jgi:hypothetical protein
MQGASPATRLRLGAPFDLVGCDVCGRTGLSPAMLGTRGPSLVLTGSRTRRRSCSPHSAWSRALSWSVSVNVPFACVSTTVSASSGVTERLPCGGAARHPRRRKSRSPSWPYATCPRDNDARRPGTPRLIFHKRRAISSICGSRGGSAAPAERGHSPGEASRSGRNALSVRRIPTATPPPLTRRHPPWRLRRPPLGFRLES